MITVLRPYDPDWLHMFKKEAHRLGQKGQDVFSSIDHIGSTAVPGMWAKPYIDMVIAVPDLCAIKKAQEILEICGYHNKGMYNIPFRWFFKRQLDPYTGFNLHLLEQGNPERAHWLMLRDFLCTHPDQAQRYSDFKKTLVARGKGPEHTAAHMLGDYTRAKNDFVEDLLVQVGVTGVCVRLCCHEQEWRVAEKLAGPWVRDQASTGIHMLVYRGACIAGYLFATEKDRQYDIHTLAMCEGALEKVKSYFIKFTERYLLFKQATCGEKEALYSSVLKKIQLFSWWREEGCEKE